MDRGHPSKIAIVVPCYNEAARLDVDTFTAYLQSTETEEVHFVFVDDGSQDATSAILSGIHTRFPERTSALILARNVGKAEAVRQGILQALRIAQVQYVGFWDADLATPLHSIESLAGVLRQRPELELIFGSRVKLLGREIDRRPRRHYLGRLFATVASLVLSLPIYDTQCGAKILRVSAITPDVFGTPFVSKWIFDVEMIARYQRLYPTGRAGLQRAVFEYPLESWKDVSGSKVRGRDFLAAITELLRIKWRYRADAWKGAGLGSAVQGSFGQP